MQPDDLERKAKKAQTSPASINNFLTKHLNVWVKAEANWMPMDAWHKCANPDLRWEDFRTVPCWIGVDLAEVKDIAAVIALFQPEHKQYVAFGKFYLPADAIGDPPWRSIPGGCTKDA